MAQFRPNESQGKVVLEEAWGTTLLTTNFAKGMDTARAARYTKTVKIIPPAVPKKRKPINKPHKLEYNLAGTLHAAVIAPAVFAQLEPLAISHEKAAVIGMEIIVMSKTTTSKDPSFFITSNKRKPTIAGMAKTRYPIKTA